MYSLAFFILSCFVLSDFYTPNALAGTPKGICEQLLRDDYVADVTSGSLSYEQGYTISEIIRHVEEAPKSADIAIPDPNTIVSVFSLADDNLMYYQTAIGPDIGTPRIPYRYFEPCSHSIVRHFFYAHAHTGNATRALEVVPFLTYLKRQTSTLAEVKRHLEFPADPRFIKYLEIKYGFASTEKIEPSVKRVAINPKIHAFSRIVSRQTATAYDTNGNPIFFVHTQLPWEMEPGFAYLTARINPYVMNYEWGRASALTSLKPDSKELQFTIKLGKQWLTLLTLHDVIIHNGDPGKANIYILAMDKEHQRLYQAKRIYGFRPVGLSRDDPEKMVLKKSLMDAIQEFEPFDLIPKVYEVAEDFHISPILAFSLLTEIRKINLNLIGVPPPEAQGFGFLNSILYIIEIQDRTLLTRLRLNALAKKYKIAESAVLKLAQEEGVFDGDPWKPVGTPEDKKNTNVKVTLDLKQYQAIKLERYLKRNIKKPPEDIFNLDDIFAKLLALYREELRAFGINDPDKEIKKMRFLIKNIDEDVIIAYNSSTLSKKLQASFTRSSCFFSGVDLIRAFANTSDAGYDVPNIAPIGATRYWYRKYGFRW
ncbi:MAG: hypothetical protein HY843_08065 [Bdellovibrio sp.]|nr:hypothetical protein [Bdellovibrio sp.]